MFKKKAIILIFTHKEEPDPFEIISFKQCYRILNQHNIRLVVPETMDISNYLKIIPDIKADRFPDMFFTNVNQYNKLKISKLFYLKYRNFNYLLTYELDAFVFTDKLEFWCHKGIDYIGAPWFAGYHEATDLSEIIGAGNSGFSLRNVKKCLKLLKFLQRSEICEKYESYSLVKLLPEILKLIYCILFPKGDSGIIRNYKGNEDYFWAIHLPGLLERINKKDKVIYKILVRLYLPYYTVADIKSAISFSFENLPRKLYKSNNNELPFGCHAWRRYDYEFWKPHIEKFGYKLPINWK